jgi:hypothetical protein
MNFDVLRVKTPTYEFWRDTVQVITTPRVSSNFGNPFLSPLPPTSANTQWSAFCHYRLAYIFQSFIKMDSCYMYFFLLASFTQGHTFETYPVCCMCVHFLPVCCWGCSIMWIGHVLLIIHLHMDSWVVFSLFVCFWQCWDLNSGPTPWAILPALFLWWVFWR